VRNPSAPPSARSPEGADSVKQFTPTTWDSPVSIRRARSAWLATSRALSSSTASNAPPIDRTSSSSVQAAALSSSVRASMTGEPSRMSS
jgi:hypothetical protein